MGSWTRIPATNIAGALGGAIRKVAGTLTLVGNKALDGVEVLIEVLQNGADEVQQTTRIIREEAEQKISEHEATARALAGTMGINKVDTVGTLDINALLQDVQTQIDKLVDAYNGKAEMSLKQIDATLASVEVSLKALLTIAATIGGLCTALEIPVVAIKVLITVLKLLPLPQRYLIVSFTILESDMLEMLTELVVQAADEILGLKQIHKTLESAIQPLIDRIERIRAKIAMIGVEAELFGASLEDQKVLSDAGLLDTGSGQQIFSVIQKGIDNGNACYGLTPEPDLNHPCLAKKIARAKEGDTVTTFVGMSGSVRDTWFTLSKDQPKLPAGFPCETGSWFRHVDDLDKKSDSFWDNLWKVDINITRTGITFGGTDSTKASTADREALESSTGDEDLFGGTKKYLILGENNFDQKPGILKVDPDNWESLVETALGKLKNIPISNELKDKLQNRWNFTTTEKPSKKDSQEVMKFQYRSKLGDLYTIEIIEDSNSPSVAVRRFARVTDEGGTVVLDGIKTFSLNTDILLTEAKLQLDNMFQ